MRRGYDLLQRACLGDGAVHAQYADLVGHAERLVCIVSDQDDGLS